MKIFVLRNAWRTNDFGGAEELALNLVLELNNFQIDAVLITGTKSLLKKAVEATAPVIECPYSKHQILTKHRAIFLPKYIVDLYLSYRSYLKIFRKHMPDIIHATGQQDCVAATSAANKLDIPIVWSDHGELKNSIGFGYKPPWGIPGILLKKRLAQIKALLMVNPLDVKFIKSLNTDIQIKIVPNGVIDKQRKKEKSKFDIVFASRVIKEKGIFELLVAFEKISKTLPKITLLIAGDGPSLQIIKNIVKRKSIKNVIFSSYKDKAINEASCFVLPTYTEAQSLAILKAMMYQTPIVTTRIDGNTHFLSNGLTALLVEPRDSASLAKALVNALTNKKAMKKMAIRARTQYSQKNVLSKIVEKYYIPIYKEYS